MLDKNDLQAIAELLKPINERLDGVDRHLADIDKQLFSIDERLSIVEEDTKITRNAVNDLIEWADDASIQTVPIFRKVK